MCRFRSGIIFQNGIVIAQADNDIHDDLLAELGIEKTSEKEAKNYVCVELLPPDDAWWTEPDSWELNIEQSRTPDWFNTSREKYLDEFRDAVKKWWKEHVYVDQEIEELSSGYYRLKRCKVKRLKGDVMVYLCESEVGTMLENAQICDMFSGTRICEMREKSCVDVMWEDACVDNMFDESCVNAMFGDSHVYRMYDRACVVEMLGNSCVSEMLGNSHVDIMWENTQVCRLHESAQVLEIMENAHVEALDRMDA